MEQNEKVRIVREAYNDLLYDGRVSSIGDFADKLEINRSTMSSAINGNEKYLTERLVRKVIKYAYGKQDVPATPVMQKVPVIPYAAHGGSLGDFADSVKAYDCEMIVSPVSGATLAMTVTGDSMAPEYPNGSKIFIQKVSGTYIDYGSVYVLDTIDGAIIKEIRRSERPDAVLCVSLNPDPKYSPFDVEFKNILGWYRVLLMMSLK